MTIERINNKISSYDIVAIISGLGIIAWIITDFFGGMVLFLFSYWFLILPIILLYIFSLFDTFISLMNGKKKIKTKLIAHGIVIFAIVTFNIYNSELLKSERILTAILKDDLYHYRLIFRKNGDVENQASGIFGFYQTYHGKYKIENGLIIFSKKPYDNDFIPDTLLLDKVKNVIFLEKDKNGDFYTKKGWLNHFEIE